MSHPQSAQRPYSETRFLTSSAQYGDPGQYGGGGYYDEYDDYSRGSTRRATRRTMGYDQTGDTQFMPIGGGSVGARGMDARRGKLRFMELVN